MAYPKGAPRPPGSGRAKGTVNKTTAQVREALVEAFERKGGVEYLMRLEDETFSRLLTKLIPAEVHAKVDAQTRLTVVDLSDQRKDEGIS